MIDLHELMERRSEAILRDCRELHTEYEIMEEDGGADWAVLAILDDLDRVIRYEFIESEESWRRPDAIDDYNDTANEGIPISVIVPNRAYIEVSTMVSMFGSRDISVFSYDAILLRKKALHA